MRSLGFYTRPSRRPRKYLAKMGIAFRELDRWLKLL
jgi:hypothetical protein